MSRANRHHVPGHVWHITQRCHDKSFLLRSAVDRRRWRYWLYQARKRYGLSVLDYVVTCNHVHLLVRDTGGDTIARSMQLVAARTAQEFNRRQERRGAFWEDRYHSTAVQSDAHLARCLVYIDLNMVRAGAVTDPERWECSGYHELMHPRARGGRLDFPALMGLLKIDSVRALQAARRSWVEQKLEEKGALQRESAWTEGLAVGGFHFALGMQRKLVATNPGRRTVQAQCGYVVREPTATYAVRTAESGLPERVAGRTLPGAPPHKCPFSGRSMVE